MLRAVDKWLPGYLTYRLRQALSGTKSEPPYHLIVGFMDHFEPLTPDGEAGDETGRRRVDQWRNRLPSLLDDVRDADGRSPRWTFFYPEEEYRPDFLDVLTEFTRNGHAEVEIHLHHSHDTPANLAERLTRFRDLLRHRHGLLGTQHNGSPAYAFIHGDWALCNAHGDGRDCGVNDELKILSDTGCYVDMTMPAGASPAQSRTVNSIYYASSSPDRPRGHDGGQPVLALPPRKPFCPLPTRGDLMLIQGPMGLNWRSRKWGLMPRIEHGDLTGRNPPTAERMRLWLRQHVHVIGRPEWIFVKLHTHGCADRNLPMLLGDPMRRFHEALASEFNDGERYRLHYVSAREMYNLVKAAEAGAHGDPNPWRDYAVQPPPAAGRVSGTTS